MNFSSCPCWKSDWWHNVLVDTRETLPKKTWKSYQPVTWNGQQYVTKRDTKMNKPYIRHQFTMTNIVTISLCAVYTSPVIFCQIFLYFFFPVCCLSCCMNLFYNNLWCNSGRCVIGYDNMIEMEKLRWLRGGSR